MTLLRTATLLLLISIPSACGDQLVEFGRGPGAGNPDAGSSGTGAPPTVLSTGPSRGAANVSVNEQIAVTFSRAMAPATLNSSTFKVRHGTTTITGVVAYADGVATFTPTSPLDLSLEYTGTITTGAADPSGSALAADYVWSFTTGACSLASLPLGAAGSLAVLAGSTVTNTGPTSITGDLGLSPGTEVTGFPPGIVVGAKHAGDPAAALGLGDLLTAYNDAVGRTLCATTVAGNLGGQTLTPGLYKSTSSLEITSGDLTLDAQGDKHAVFIFQMASTLTTTSGRQVILSGGARAANVFWQVGSSATLGTTSAFQGTIMADQSITMEANATLTGRVLARIGGVTMSSNTIVVPAR
jgi:ice-binding like protein/Big-like domain-containing protein